jgi:cardiolipin synthase
MGVVKKSKDWIRKHPRLHRGCSWINQRRKRLTVAFVFISHVIGALTSVSAIMQTRTSQGAIAWVVSLNTLPYVAVPAYWVFGSSDFDGYVTARRNLREQLMPFWNEFEQELRDKDLIYDPDRKDPFVSEELAMLPATRGNSVELLIDGDETFPSIFEGIAKAEDYVLVQFYIIKDDSVGRELRDVLVERAKAGVRCHLLYDEIGSRLPQDFLDSLTDAGVVALPFNSTDGGTNRFQINFRNHRKIVIVDGKTAWVGGLNVGKEYKGLDPKFGYWRDTHLKMSGPVVQCVQVAFSEDWLWAAKEEIKGLNWQPARAVEGPGVGMLCLPSGPVDPLETCTLFFLYAINMAKERLWIASPYFVPDEQFISALQLAALRGVDVRIIIPDKADNPLVQLSAWSYMKELEKVDIKVYRYTKGFMHHKVMVVDDLYSTVGTANFDNRSFRLNFEVTMGVADPEFTTEVAEMLQQDMSDSRLMRKGEFDEKGFFYRLGARAARLTAPIQ